MGIPLCTNQGFPNCPPATSQIGNSLSKTYIMTIEYGGSNGALEICFHILFSFVIICLNPIECKRLISKENNLIKMMCKLS